MSDQPGGFDIGNLFQQAQALQQELQKAQEAAKQKTVEASSGGGMVTAVVTGGLELRKLKIDAGAVDPKDLTLLEDLVVAAVNQALQKALAMMQEEVAKLAGGMQLPPGLLP
jgi:DNA-binding YbaB/EbfC family protein